MILSALDSNGVIVALQADENGQLKVAGITSGGTTGTAQIYIEGTASFTRPANTTTYTAGDAVYNSTTGAAALSMTMTVIDTAEAVTPGSAIVITGAKITTNNATATVNPTMDLMVSPATFTANNDNAPMTLAYATRANMTIIPVDFAMLFGAGGTEAYSNDVAVRLKLADASSDLFLQPRLRLAYVPESGEAFTIKLSGFVVA